MDLLYFISFFMYANFLSSAIAPLLLNRFYLDNNSFYSLYSHLNASIKKFRGEM